MACLKPLHFRVVLEHAQKYTTFHNGQRTSSTSLKASGTFLTYQIVDSVWTYNSENGKWKVWRPHNGIPAPQNTENLNTVEITQISGYP